MDDFKKKNVNEYTAWDIGVSCVCYSDKAKAKDKRKLARHARRRLKEDMKKECLYGFERISEDGYEDES